MTVSFCNAASPSIDHNHSSISTCTDIIILTILDPLNQLYDSGGRLAGNTNLKAASSQKMTQIVYKMAVFSKHRDKSTLSCQVLLSRR